MDISIIKNAVDDKFIQSIIDVGESQKLEEASIGGKSSTSNNIRSTKIIGASQSFFRTLKNIHNSFKISINEPLIRIDAQMSLGANLLYVSISSKNYASLILISAHHA